MNLGLILRAMRHNRTRVVLIVLEFAMTLAIITNCITVILNERSKMNRRSGFDDDHIMRLAVHSFAPEFRNPAFVDTILDSDVRAIAAVPGVRAAANTTFQPWQGHGTSSKIFAVGAKGEPVTIQMVFGSRDLMQALGATIIEGRTFQDGDLGIGSQDDPADKVIISKTVADLLFPDGHAVGKMLQTGSPNDPSGNPMTVIGVIREFYNPFGVGNAVAPESDRALFIPLRMGGRESAYLVRTEPGATRSVMQDVERRLTMVHPGRAFEFSAIVDEKRGWFAGDKIVVTTMTCIVIALVVVTALGLLGITSLSIAERTRQIGTRRALGATRSDILRHFLTENLVITTAGLALGVAGAYALNFLLVSHVSDVKLQWQLVVAGIVLLAIDGFVATIPPALRATMVPPS